jgi:hypothetical protein
LIKKNYGSDKTDYCNVVSDFSFGVHNPIYQQFLPVVIFSQSPPTADSAQLMLDLEKL